MTAPAQPPTPEAASPQPRPTLPHPFPLQRWRIRARVRRSVQWPGYEGSTLRGVWGHALRRAVCVTRAPDCRGCPLAERCAYPALFEPAPPAGSRSYGDMAPPCVIEPGGGPRSLSPGDSYHFHLVLFGRALADAAIVRFGWQQALGRNLGILHGAMDIEGVDIVDDGIALPAPEAAPGRIGVRLLTPLYLKRGGSPLPPQHFTAGDFAWAVLRRAAEVCELHLQCPTGLDFPALKDQAASLRWGTARWQWQGFERWSNRQQRATPLCGIVGEGLIEGDLRPFWPLLHLGQWLHAGGKTSFGLGQYRLLD